MLRHISRPTPVQLVDKYCPINIICLPVRWYRIPSLAHRECSLGSYVWRLVRNFSKQTSIFALPSNERSIAHLCILIQVQILKS